ncbi:MAG: TMEM165/GDT1 family protein [Desulfomicrobium sp.]|nr:TMEM165/GDT1 family protein [Desulfomicrobium sp.]
MDSVFSTTFALIFLAELGDKTQLTAMALAMRYPWRRVFAGIAIAFALLNLAAVLVGKLFFTFLPVFWITLASAILFIYFGYSTFRHGCEQGEDAAPLTASSAFRTAFIMIFMAELGDKSQLVTASQAARHSGSFSDIFLVFSASTLALWLVSLLGIFLGKKLLSCLPACWIQRLAGGLFFLFGLLMLYSCLKQ